MSLFCPNCLTFIPDHPDQINAHIWGKKHMNKTMKANGRWEATLVPTNGNHDKFHDLVRERKEFGREKSGYYHYRGYKRYNEQTGQWESINQTEMFDQPTPYEKARELVPANPDRDFMPMDSLVNELKDLL